MINIKEIPVERVNQFWEKHLKYLIEDEIISGKDDIEYFSSDEYRNTIISHMKREKDKHHMVYFMR